MNNVQKKGTKKKEKERERRGGGGLGTKRHLLQLTKMAVMVQ